MAHESSAAAFRDTLSPETDPHWAATTVPYQVLTKPKQIVNRGRVYRGHREEGSGD
jgi:hypothetical protein